MLWDRKKEENSWQSMTSSLWVQIPQQWNEYCLLLVSIIIKKLFTQYAVAPCHQLNLNLKEMYGGSGRKWPESVNRTLVLGNKGNGTKKNQQKLCVRLWAPWGWKTTVVMEPGHGVCRWSWRQQNSLGIWGSAPTFTVSSSPWARVAHLADSFAATCGHTVENQPTKHVWR